jgi:hypothetical protein
VSEALEVGIVWVNCSQPCFCQAPWGGVKDSGFGRELGTFGLENFLSVKQVGGGACGWADVFALVILVPVLSALPPACLLECCHVCVWLPGFYHQPKLWTHCCHRPSTHLCR